MEADGWVEAREAVRPASMLLQRWRRRGGGGEAWRGGGLGGGGPGPGPGGDTGGRRGGAGVRAEPVGELFVLILVVRGNTQLTQMHD